MTREIIVDSFAGGGGASLGIEMATGRSPDIAINHDLEAIALYAANHPDSKHYCENVWAVDPVEACAGRPVGLMWLSPDCKHFSKAKGGKPVSKKIRGLAWVACRWAKAVRPRVIVLENVEEFQTWGPLGPDGMPDKLRRGDTFRRFTARLRRLGYVVEHRELRACDYGAPTIRKRLFLIARRDGQPIVWPKPTHGKGRALPWRTAAECIDWSIPCPSIFERKKPLAENTLRRIARGIRRYVIESPRPFIVVNTSGHAATSITDPLPTVTTGGHHMVVTPYAVPLTHHGSDRIESLEAPMSTITGAHRGERALIAPTLIQTGYGEDKHRNNGAGQSPRSLDLHQPLGTVVGGGGKHALVAAFLAKHYTGVVGSQLDLPMATVTSVDHHSLVTATLEHTHGSDGSRADSCQDGRDRGATGRHRMETPEHEHHVTRSTEASRDAREERVSARQGLSGLPAASRMGAPPCVDDPARSDSGRYGAQSSERSEDRQLSGEPGTGHAERESAPRIQNRAAFTHEHSRRNRAESEGSAHAGPDVSGDRGNARRLEDGGVPGHTREVAAFLAVYYGNEKEGATLFDPMRTVTSKERFGLVTVEGAEYVITDIGMRMLVPRELARAQGFNDAYILEYGIDPNTGDRVAMNKTAQVRMIGNSVCPDMAAAIVAANYSVEREVMAA